ncbi:UTP--glucose-1-phosphate uridylyltransferase GalU [Candidatus Peregrinibacteria bacterium]|nr:UTP--glucose-1-phosphate uridylyltransferase GalU [Candidatus Peregrinibacteria bacterium]
MKIKKVIIPAAGLGTRFLPATKSQSKEMLPIVDKPCIQYLVEEAVASGINEIIIITGRGKRSIEDHFDYSFELNWHLRNKKKVNALREIERIEKLAKIVYVRQPFPLGDGHAVLCAKNLVENEPFAVLFGDDIYDGKTPPLKQMIEEFEKYSAPIVALQKIDKKETNKYGIINPKSKLNGKTYEIKNLIEKPSPKKAPSNLAIVGKYIITPKLLQPLDRSKSGTKDKELRLIDGMRNFIKTSPIYGREIEGTRFDTGDKIGYLKAVVHFGLKHKDLSQEFKSYLKKLDLK